MPALKSIRRDSDGVGNELLDAPPDPGQRCGRSYWIDPAWNLLDTPSQGRGEFFPKLACEPSC